MAMKPSHRSTRDTKATLSSYLAAFFAQMQATSSSITRRFEKEDNYL